VRTLEARRKAGPAFVAQTLGMQFPVSRTFALTLELKWMAMLGASASAAAASAGLTQGL
jgi:hypothetical protein